jgi:mono/diheme cytochrome c family protein
VDHEQHEAIARWERRWLNAAGLLLAFFVILVAYSLATEGGHIAQRSGRTTPEQLSSLELFARPGVTITNVGAGQATEARVTLVAQSFSFAPAEIILPAGAVTTFHMTSRDTLHGFQVQDTTINTMLIPGEIATLTYTFDKPGVYRTTCNEYCGGGHHTMMGTVRVLYPSEYAAATAAAPPTGAEEASSAVGEGAYTANCAGCHQADGQGLPGVFPPLAGHAAELLEADRSYLPNVLLYGLTGEIQVGGETYNGQMPAWSQLSDEEIAGTLNYLLSAWAEGGKAPDQPYTPEEIAPLRDEALSPGDVHALRQNLTFDD